MAGIYIHIPFCKQACYYCDFHFSTQHGYFSQMLVAMQRELSLQQHYLTKHCITTIYFGGGTPSLCSPKDIYKLLEEVAKYYMLSKHLEITLEANPDDLDFEKLQAFKKIGINRLSIGIQSFQDILLQKMHRAHNAQAAIRCVDDARQAGFDNISIDLIYAIPSQTKTMWADDLQQAFRLLPEHIAAYMLTIEPKTVFAHWQKIGKLPKMPDDLCVQYFEMLTQACKAAGYVHYEISNFCQPRFASQHNSHYWLQTPYLGIGPSAHSYNGSSRQYNVSNNHRYMQSIVQNKIPCTKEILTRQDLINEYILTRLRIIEGCDLLWLQKTYRYNLYQEKGEIIDFFLHKNFITVKNDILCLTHQGKLWADKITADLML